MFNFWNKKLYFNIAYLLITSKFKPEYNSFSIINIFSLCLNSLLDVNN